MRGGLTDERRDTPASGQPAPITRSFEVGLWLAVALVHRTLRGVPGTGRVDHLRPASRIHDAELVRQVGPDERRSHVDDELSSQSDELLEERSDFDTDKIRTKRVHKRAESLLETDK